MDIEEAWHKALSHTQIIRARVSALLTNADTTVPYVFLAESSVNFGDTVVRKGEIIVQKPSLLIPPHNPIFQGFQFQDEMQINEDSLVNFLLVRGVVLPSLKYDNKTNSLSVVDGKLSEAIRRYSQEMEQQENVQTGLLSGPEDCWQFSVLIFICSQILRNADTDFRKLREKFKRNES
ncbi:MAG: hypothetical protein HQL23_06900 [Candidatus Omnitrophica bacterium]|nr:hypothetical protein [Candidatus Omnitrophota bacterium]